MSQTPHVKVYRTNLGDVSPFQRKIVPKRNKKNSKKSSNNDSEESGKGSSEERGKGPSGSHWSTSQLNWLGILFQDELNIEEVFTTKYILSDKIIQVIRKAIYAEKHWTWAEVEANEDLFEEESWFNRLLILTSICRESRGYSQSSPLQPSLSEQNQGSESLDCDEHDSKSPTPRPKTLRNVTTAEPGEKARAHFVLPEESEGLSTFPPSTSGSQSPTVGADEPRLPSLPVAPSAASSRKRPARFVRSPGHRNTTEPESPGLSDRSTPPKRIKEQFPPRALPDFTNHEKSSSRALKQAEDVRSDRKDKDGNEDGNVDVQKEDEDEIEDKGEDDGQDEGDNEGGNEDEGEHTKEKGPSAALPDTIHKATSSRASKSAEDVASPNQDKDEEEVKSAAHAFLDIIANALKAAAPKMPTQVMKSSEHRIAIDNVPMTSQPDVTLRVQIKNEDKGGDEPKVEVVIECKRRITSKTADNLLGQEVSELLGEAIRQDERAKPSDSYATYLISWHHMKCYLSRFDVTKEWLQKLQNSASLQHGARAQVRRSRPFDLKDPDDRLKFATLAAQLMVDQLAKYNRHHKSRLIEYLTADSKRIR